MSIPQRPGGSPRPARPAPGEPAPGSRARFGLAALFALAILSGSALGLVLASASDLPQVGSLEDYQPNIVTEVYTADGRLLGDFAIERRVVVSFQDIPPVLRNAVVAVEDADFWKHLGINVWRIPGAVVANVRSGRRGQGFSTLTMQLSRLLFLTPEKTYERKLKEVILAFQIEKNFTKEEVFTLYCNQVYFGHGQYGVQAASDFYFSKPIAELTLVEAALLAGLPQSPNRLSPVENPAGALQRRNHVLERMYEEKYVTRGEWEVARNAPLQLRLRKAPPSLAPYFLEEVRKHLEREYGSQRIYQGGLRVHTTLDSRLQEAANGAMARGLRSLDRRARGYVTPPSVLVDGRFPEPLHLEAWDRPLAVGDAVPAVVLESDRQVAVVQVGDRRARLGPREVEWTKRPRVSDALPRGSRVLVRVEALQEEGGQPTARVTLEQEPRVEGALLALDTRTGAVRAMVGGYDFERSKFNRATQAYRQPGSVFKPIVYTAAIEAASYTPATIVLDAPISFPAGGGGVWAPHNYDFTFKGPIPLRLALEQSRNVPAIRTLQAIGIDRGIEYARKLGLGGEFPPYLPIAIGAGEVTLTEITAAFATFANQGLRMKPMLVTRITDRDGNVLEERRPEARDAIRADTAYIMTTLLRGVVERGTAVRARRLGRPIAGKTGTTNDFTDGWFVGFETRLAAGVWVGFDEKTESLGRGSDGARTALPIWMDFWSEAMKDQPVEEPAVPANIVFVPVDGAGSVASAGVPGTRMEAFVAGTEPRASRASAAQ